MPWGFAIAAGVGAVGSIVAGGEQASGQEQAANTQAGMLNTVLGYQQPFIQGGYGAENTLNQLLGTSPTTGTGGTAAGTNLPGGYLTQQFAPTQAQMNAYPGYQFALQTGGQATRNADTPGVGALSGPALKDLTNFNVGTANQYYGQYFNQFQQQQNNIFNRLSGIAQMGQAGAAGVGSAATQLGTGIAQAQAGEAGSIAGGIVGATNSVGNSSIPLAYMLSQPGNPGYGGGMSLGGQAAEAYCDFYLKTALEPIRFEHTAGLMLYEFEYKYNPGKKHRGVIAQEAQKRYPDAVSRGPKGYLMVDYSKLPIDWEALDELNNA